MVLLIREIMRSDFLAVPPDRSALECVQAMVARHEGVVLVVDGGKTVGIATEWDFMAKLFALEKDPRSIRIAEIATQPVRTVDAKTPTIDVIEAMADSGIRRMVVTEGDRTIGIVTAKDVFRAFRAYMDRVSSDIAKLQSMSL
jgi:signal-transduction protein with cAMP-binding, CBS, and nucleotidyltransferase domain